MQVWLFSENDKIEKLTKAFPNLNIIALQFITELLSLFMRATPKPGFA